MKTFTDEQIIEWLIANNKKLYNYEEIEDKYENLLTETYGAVNICGREFRFAGAAYRQLEPVGFRSGVSDWCAGEFEEIGDGDKYVSRSDYDEAIDALTEIAELTAMEEAENDD